MLQSVTNCKLMMFSYNYMKHVNKTTFRKVHLKILQRCTKLESGTDLFTLSMGSEPKACACKQEKKHCHLDSLQFAKS